MCRDLSVGDAGMLVPRTFHRSSLVSRQLDMSQREIEPVLCERTALRENSCWPLPIVSASA